MKKHTLQRAYWITMLVLFFPFIFPLFQVANRPTPIILGLPFSLFWICLWMVIVFLTVLIFYWLDPDNTKGE